jgi:hypothetical protein
MPPVPFKVPAWADPNNASVLDSPLQKAARTLGGIFGAADPQAQVMAIATPIELPGGPLTTLKAYHGSPRTLNELQPGSMMPTDPVWAAGYTTDPSWPGAGPDRFVGRVHAADVPIGGKTLEAPSLHGAEDVLLRTAQRVLKRPARTLREAADAVSSLGYRAVISRGTNGEINGVIPLHSVSVSSHLDPASIVNDALSKGRNVPTNLKAIVKP